MVTKVYKQYIVMVLLLLSTLLLGSAQATNASTESVISSQIKCDTVKLYADTSYVDHISFMTKEKEVDLIVKMQFNEDDNTITVSALSYIPLLGFEQDVRYGSIIKWKKFRYEKMPYVMESDPTAKYKTTKELRHSMKPHKRHSIFSNWVQSSQGTFELSKYNVINDYLEKKFTLTTEVTKLNIKLNDMMVIESPKDMSKKHLKYKIFAIKDLNKSYNVELMRDPCRGQDEEIQRTATNLQNIIMSYNSLKSMAASTPGNDSKDSLDMFNSLKRLMKEKYSRDTIVSRCSAVVTNQQLYNSYADSISMTKGYYDAPKIDPKVIYDAARQIDKYSTRWSITTDEVEQDDIVDKGTKLIDQTQTTIATQVKRSSDLAAAIKLFNSAKANFYFITKRESR